MVRRPARIETYFLKFLDFFVPATYVCCCGVVVVEVSVDCCATGSVQSALVPFISTLGQGRRVLQNPLHCSSCASLVLLNLEQRLRRVYSCVAAVVSQAYDLALAPVVLQVA